MCKNKPSHYSGKFQLTLLHKLSPLDPFLNLLLVREMRLCGKCAVQAVSEVGVSKRVFAAEEEEFCRSIYSFRVRVIVWGRNEFFFLFLPL